MNFGVLTWCKAINHGAISQAYASQQVLKSCGISPTFLDYERISGQVVDPSSFSESFSLVLIEAQAQNVRCIASSAIPEEVICNSNCMRVSLNESDDVWAEYAISDIKNQAVKPIEEFDIQTVIRNMCAEYQKIIDAERGEEIAG